MKRILQIIALVLAVATVATWTALGASRGWTKTEAQVKTVDEITGIEGISYQKKFQPGLDFLGAGLIGAAVLATVGLVFRPKTK